MKLIAEQTVHQFLVELAEDEVDEIEGGEMMARVTRPEGAGKRARLWVDEDELEDLIRAALSDEDAEAFRRTVHKLPRRT